MPFQLSGLVAVNPMALVLFGMLLVPFVFQWEGVWALRTRAGRWVRSMFWAGAAAGFFLPAFWLPRGDFWWGIF
jgi:hypothetical protein